MQDLLMNYLPILVFLGVAAGLGLVLILAAVIVAVRNPDSEKTSAYECGFNAFDDARMKFASGSMASSPAPRAARAADAPRAFGQGWSSEPRAVHLSRRLCRAARAPPRPLCWCCVGARSC